MADFAIVEDPGEMPERDRRPPTDYRPMLAQARDAGGEWVPIKALDEASRKKISSIVYRLNEGGLAGSKRGEYEARGAVKRSMFWVRYLGPVEEEE